MNIDKFGHYVHKRMRSVEPSNLLEKSLAQALKGECKLKLQSLQILNPPLSDNHAVNKQYMDKVMADFYTKSEINKQLQIIKSDMLLLIDQLQNNVFKKHERIKTTIDSKNEKTRNNK